VNAPVPRRANGTVMKGYTANPGGRPRSTIEQVREALLPDLPLFLLTQSSNETIRLQALREVFERLCGKSAVFVDATHTKVDIGQLYLAALKRANGVVDGGLNGSVGAASE
jgi:hypothetical protein